MANIKFIAVSRSLSGILDYVTNREKTVEQVSYPVSTAWLKQLRMNSKR